MRDTSAAHKSGPERSRRRAGAANLVLRLLPRLEVGAVRGVKSRCLKRPCCSLASCRRAICPETTTARKPQHVSPGWVSFGTQGNGFGLLAGNCRARDFLAAYSLYGEEQRCPAHHRIYLGHSPGSIMSKSLYSAEHWRMRAQQIMAMADKARSQEERDALLGIAQDYERLALQTEKSTDLLKSGPTKRWVDGSLKPPTNERA